LGSQYRISAGAQLKQALQTIAVKPFAKILNPANIDAERFDLPLTTALNSRAGSGMLRNGFKPKTRSTLIDDDDQHA
jgi:hypothetical protein